MLYLIDCNSFFVSCERLFNPALTGKPVIVLSSNDGCVVSRSAEAKALGIPMGVPLFTIKDLVEKHKVHAFSSNFSLYQNISARIMQRLDELVEGIQVYSIDEAFLTIRRFNSRIEHITHAQLLRTIILKEIGIPISIGIAPTKTLAKLASDYAKKYLENRGVYYLTGTAEDDTFLETLPVSDVWGIGYEYQKLLNTYQIKTVHALKYAHQGWIRKRMTVIGLRTVLELNGQACIELEDAQPKQLIYSRSFGERVTSYAELERILLLYITKAARRLRRYHCATRSITVYITTGKHATFTYSKSAHASLPAATQFTPTLFDAVQPLLKEIYKQGYGYKKIGIMLSDIVAEDAQQESFLAAQNPDRIKQDALMEAVDKLQYKWGDSVIFFGTPMANGSWKTKSGKRSPNYVTRWNELPKVK